MKESLILVMSIMLIVLVLIFTNFGNSTNTVIYDCRDAHWHPDFPAKVKEECRKLLIEEIERLKREEEEKKIIRT